MKTKRTLILTAGVALAFLAHAHGQEMLYGFQSGQAGVSAPATSVGGDTSLVLASDGNFYGTTPGNGRSNYGTVFEMTPAGVLTTLVSFANTNGSSPQGGLVQGSDGNFYGTTYSGGNLSLNGGTGFGTVFKMTPDGILSMLLALGGLNGANPSAGLVQGSDGNFYGTTLTGGSAGEGTVFKMTPAGILTSLVSFTGANGAYPGARIIQATNGNFYGTAYWGGSANLGTVFRLTPAGALSTLVTFTGANGAHPAGGVMQGSDGNLYGTTYYGGNLSLNGGNGYGSIFKVSLAGTFSTLTNFSGTNGAHPYAGVIEGSDGNLYGTTYWGGDLPADSAGWFGTAFEITPTKVLTTLFTFTANNGAFPLRGLVQGTNGDFYGATSLGGPAGGGTIFRFSLASPLSIIQQPDDQFVCLGADARFHAAAAGAAPFSYQWNFNGAPLLNATNRSLTLTNVQLTNAGNYSLIITNFSGSVTSRVATLQVDPIFTAITTGEIVTNPGAAIGCAWGDYDHDGFIDLIVTSPFSPTTGAAQKNILFHNNRDGTFVKITSTVITAEARDWRGCSWVDYDNDGFLDLYVTSTDYDTGFAAANELFRNNGDGTFKKMTSSDVGIIVTNLASGSEGPIWADYDNDGFIDMFMPRYGPDWLFHNNGNTTFNQMATDVAGLGIDNQDSYQAAWGDYNNDGLPDLFVTVKSDPPSNRLYLNLGGGSFARVTSGSVATDYAHSFSPTWVDYDNDGYLDLFISNGGYVGTETCFLYHNEGDGSFTRMTSETAGNLVSDIGEFGSSTWGDFDNDGYLDLFVVRNGVQNLLYHNNGNGSFTRILTGSLTSGSNVFPVGCACGDYDNDGFLDIFVARNGFTTLEKNLLYHNNGNSNGWIGVKLVGTVSNRSAIGAKVRIRATIGGKTFWQMREINTGNGFGEGPLEAHFGLGDATNVESLRIEWPSGTVQEFQNVAAKQILTITEPPRLLATVTDGVPQFSLKGGRGFQYEIDSSTNLTAWSSIGTLTVTNLNGIAQIIDTNLPTASRFYRAVSR